MNITYSNYPEQIKKVDWSSFPKNILDVKDEMDEFHELYNDDETIKETFDLFLEKVNKHLAASTPKNEKNHFNTLSNGDTFSFSTPKITFYAPDEDTRLIPESFLVYKGKKVSDDYKLFEDAQGQKFSIGENEFNKAINENVLIKSKLPSKTSSKDIYQKMYDNLLKIFPDLEKTNANLKNDIYEKQKLKGYDLFSVESWDYNPQLQTRDFTISHTYTQMGDLMSAPRMDIRVNFKLKTVESLTYEAHNTMPQVYEVVYDDGKVDLSAKKRQNEFLSQWLKNLIAQGFKINFNTDKKKDKKPAKEKNDLTPVPIESKIVNGTKYELIKIGNTGKVKLIIPGGKSSIGTLAQMKAKYDGFTEAKPKAKAKPNKAEQKANKPKYKVGDKFLNTTNNVKVSITEVQDYMYRISSVTGKKDKSDDFQNAATFERYVKDGAYTILKDEKSKSPCDDAIENYLENKKAARAKAAKKSERNKIATSLDAENVSYFNDEFRLLRRFYNMVTKKGNVPFRTIQLLYMAFQKTAIARKVRKTSDLAHLFEASNEKLTKLYNVVSPEKLNANINFEDKEMLEKLKTLVTNKKVDYTVTLLNRVINLQGTSPDDAKVNRVIAAIENAIKNKKVDERNRLYDDLVKGKNELKKYLNDKVEKIPARNYGLSGVKKKV